jgi:plastocyanin
VPGTTSAPAKGGDTITIQSFAFHPLSLTVAPGATVTVHNTDGATHTVTASGPSKGAFDTGDISPNQTITFTAPTRPGAYPYICNIHQFMMGTLIVS